MGEMGGPSLGEIGLRTPEAVRGRLVVEIGTYGRPAISHGTRKVEQNEFYVTVNQEPGEKEEPNYAEKDLAAMGGRKDAAAINGDARDLQFSSGSVDELICTNVLGSGAEGKYRILREASRVLKDDGQLTVVETYTPEDVPSDLISFDLKERKVKFNNEEFRMLGFRVDSFSRKKEDIRVYNNRGEADEDPLSFKLVLKRLPRESKLPQ